MNGRRNRAYGHAFECKVAHDLTNLCGFHDTKRRLEDREGSDDITHPFERVCSIQCRARRTLAITSWLKEMIERKPECLHHFLVVQPSRRPAFVVVPYAEWLEQMKVWQDKVWT